jgi:HEAT repeat protein
LAEFRKRTPSVESNKRIRELIRRLGDDDFAVRDRASADLRAHGTPAIPLLREAIKDEDLERRRRAEECLQQIEQSADRSLPLVAPGLLALRKPAGAAEALLAYLPSAENESMTQEIVSALAALAVRDRQPHPALMRALKDPNPGSREAAAVALTRAGVADSRPFVRKLLADDSPAVRVTVALALTAAGDRGAVDVLLDALTRAPLEQGRKAYDSLYALAGDKAPATSFGEDAASRKKCQEVWTRWWRENGAAADLANLTAPRLLGYTLIVEQAANDGKGRVLELGRDGKVRWQIEQLQAPVDAQILPGSRVLVAEAGAMRVTERDFKGNILWRKEGVNGTLSNVQRLTNGQTFIATDQEVLLVDRAGKDIFRRNFGEPVVYGAAQVRNGDIFCFMEGGTCLRVNSSGQEIKTFPSGRNSHFTGGIDVLSNGHVLITQPNQNAVVEVDGDGKTYRRIAVAGVTAASWTPEGHILAACCDARKVVELDGTGKVLWTYNDGFRPFRARRR